MTSSLHVVTKGADVFALVIEALGKLLEPLENVLFLVCQSECQRDFRCADLWQINDKKARTIDKLVVVYDISARLTEYAIGGVDVWGMGEYHGR
jgi:hypothetical protein